MTATLLCPQLETTQAVAGRVIGWRRSRGQLANRKARDFSIMRSCVTDYFVNPEICSIQRLTHSHYAANRRRKTNTQAEINRLLGA